MGREQGQSCSPSWHSVARVEYGTIMVQEVFSSWRETLICGSNMWNTFEKPHVRGWSYVLTRAYLHEPTSLPLCGLDLLVENPHDYLTFEALEGQEGGENFVYACIDYLTQYLHLLSISMQCLVPQEGSLFLKLHDQYWARLYDGDNHISYGLGKVSLSMHV